MVSYERRDGGNNRPYPFTLIAHHPLDDLKQVEVVEKERSVSMVIQDSDIRMIF